jgi:uncharacterized membrane protein
VEWEFSMAVPFANYTVAHAPIAEHVTTPLRCTKERILQSLCFEAGGLLLVVPAYALIFASSAKHSFGLLFVLSLLVLAWSPLHNTVFDWWEARLTGGVASDRPHGLRFVHATSHEATSVAVTLPALMWLGGHGFWGAIAVDVCLTLTYAAYAYVFHLAFDWLRPVVKGA